MEKRLCSIDPIVEFVNNKCDERSPDKSPELIKYITWSSLLSKATGNTENKRSTAISPKNSRKFLYLYMQTNCCVNINILTNG